MPTFCKIIKNKAYFSRYQVKYRRRREGKTDYAARRKMIVQDKNKYNAPKYRLVVRFTNKDIICQIMYSKIAGDVCMCAAYSHELPRYGIKQGLTNYAAAYATGLLVARRCLSQIGLADKYVGVEKPNGEHVLTKLPEDEEDYPRPFKVLLDVGLARTTTGARVFAAMKGASDGGIFVPHKPSRLVGYDSEKNKFDPAVLRKYIFGGHVAAYMQLLKTKNPEKYAKQFSQYVKDNIQADQIEKIYAAAHEAIRKDPKRVPAQPREKYVPKVPKLKKLTYRQKKARVFKKLSAMAAQVPQD